MLATKTANAAANPCAPSAPTALHQRIDVLDTLRGIAVLGILLINIQTHSGLYWLPDRLVEGSPTPLLDQITLYVIGFFAATKFITIFSLLFGAGLALQLERARARGVAANAFFVRRMGWLFLIGLAHGQIWPNGDILRFYALLGVVMIVMVGLSNRALIILGWTFGAFVTAGLFILMEIMPLGFGLSPAAYKAAIFDAYSHDSLSAVFATNAALNLSSILDGGLLSVVSCFGKFLLGFWMMRIGLFRHPEHHRQRLGVWIRYGLLFGLPGSLVYVLIVGGVIVLSPALLWLPFAAAAGLLLHGFLYVALVLKYQHTRPMIAAGRVLRPVGRMALSNYILQSVLCAFLFYNTGAGLFGEVGHAYLMFICLGIFALQIVGSHLWLTVLPYGPLEWVWRRLSYGRLSRARDPGTRISV